MDFKLCSQCLPSVKAHCVSSTTSKKCSWLKNYILIIPKIKQNQKNPPKTQNKQTKKQSTPCLWYFVKGGLKVIFIKKITFMTGSTFG